MRIRAEGDTFYRGHEGGYDAADVTTVADRLDALDGGRFAGITTFPDGRPIQLIDVASIATLEKALALRGVDAQHLWTSPRLMRDAFSNLDIMEPMREALSSLGVDLDEIATLEPAPWAAALPWLSPMAALPSRWSRQHTRRCNAGWSASKRTMRSRFRVAP